MCVCVLVCVCERERESEYVCSVTVCVCVYVLVLVRVRGDADRGQQLQEGEQEGRRLSWTLKGFLRWMPNRAAALPASSSEEMLSPVYITT